MPHNRTRFWVGLAIAAVTIPAVGQFYYNSTANANSLSATAGTDRWSAARGQDNSTGAENNALRRAERDYESEVIASSARQGLGFPRDESFATEDAIFDIDPLDEPDVYPLGYDAPRLEGVPDPADELAPTEGDQPERVASNGGYPDEDEALEEEIASSGLTDAAVYRTVVSGLSPEERDEFVRSWAVMTPDQRAALLDEFRASMQDEG